MMLDWLFNRKAYLARRAEYEALVQRDADDLIARFGGGQAYAETLCRALREQETIDGNRPEGHWYRVREIIAERLGITIGLTGRDRAQH